jgi:hypothetical protein
MVDVICGVVTEGTCATESVHPAKTTEIMIRKIVIIPIWEIFTILFPQISKKIRPSVVLRIHRNT